MATYQQEFIELARELMTEFDDFAADAVVESSTGFDYRNQTTRKVDNTFRAIRYEDNQWNGSNASIRVIKLIATYAAMGATLINSMTPGNTRIQHDGVTYSLIDVERLPGNTAIILDVKEV